MFRLVLKKVATFSVIGAFAFALLVLDTDSPSLMSEANACDASLFNACMYNCGWSCLVGMNLDCAQSSGNGEYCQDCCVNVCSALSGC